MSLFNFKKSTQATSSAPSNTNTKPVNPASFAFYINLCEQKGQNVIHTSTSSHQEVQEAIEKLTKLPNFKPASPAQWDKINTYTTDLNLPMIDKKLSITEASELIQKLSIIWEGKGFHERITAPMIEMLEKMAKCPDIPAFTLFVPTEMLDQADLMQAEHDRILADINSHTPTMTEADLDAYEAEMAKFEEELMAMSEQKSFSSVKKSDAQAFIQAYKTIFYAWDNNRPSDMKINLLQTLYRRTGQEFTYDELRQYSNKEADSLINQLQKEQSYNFAIGQEPSAREVKRGPRTLEEIVSADHAKLEAFIHGVSAIIGQQADPELINTMAIKDMLDLVTMAAIYDEEAANSFVKEADFFDKEVVEELMQDTYYTIEEKDLIKKLFSI